MGQLRTTIFDGNDTNAIVTRLRVLGTQLSNEFLGRHVSLDRLRHVGVPPAHRNMAVEVARFYQPHLMTSARVVSFQVRDYAGMILDEQGQDVLVSKTLAGCFSISWDNNTPGCFAVPSEASGLYRDADPAFADELTILAQETFKHCLNVGFIIELFKHSNRLLSNNTLSRKQDVALLFLLMPSMKGVASQVGSASLNKLIRVPVKYTQRIEQLPQSLRAAFQRADNYLAGLLLLPGIDRASTSPWLTLYMEGTAIIDGFEFAIDQARI